MVTGTGSDGTGGADDSPQHTLDTASNPDTNPNPDPGPNPHPRRIAFISSFWFEHSVGKLLSNIVIGLHASAGVEYTVDVIQV